MVCLDNRSHNREPKPRSAGAARTRAIGAGESLEELAAQLGLDAGAVVAHANHRMVAVGLDRRHNFCARGCVRASVREQICEHLRDAGRITGDRDGLIRQLKCELVVGARRMCIADGLDGEVREIHAAVDELLPLVEAGE